MKKFISIILGLLMTSLALPVNAAVGTQFSYSGAYYEVLSETELTVACLGSSVNQWFLFSPTVTNNGKTYTVTELRKDFSPTRYFNMDFSGYASYQYKVKVIGDGVFEGTSLDPNTIPSSVEVIGARNFYGRTDITSLKIPNGVKSIGASCFYNCKNIASITFNYNLETIGANCFSNCNALTSVNLSFNYNLIEIGNDAFLACQSLKSVDLKSAEKIGAGCFQACQKMESITLPSNLKQIGGSAFLWCSALKNIIIPSKVERIEDRAFEHLENLQALIFTSPSEPAYVNWQGEDIDFSACIDDNAASKMWVPSRKTYEHGTEMITFEEKELVYTGVSPEIQWTNNTPWSASINTSNLPYGAGEHTVPLETKFTDGLDLTFTYELTYSISKAPLTLKVNDFERVYGTFSNNFSCSYEGLVNSETASTAGIYPNYSCEANYKSHVGTYEITATLNAANYEATVIPGTLTITKAPLTAQVSPSRKIYGDPLPTFNCSYNGFKEWETSYGLTSPVSFSTEATQESPVGTYVVTASGGTFQDYTITEYIPSSIQVNPATLKVTPNNAERIYGDDNPEFSVTYEGFKLGENSLELLSPFTFTAHAGLSTAVGTYPIEVSGGSSQNYIFSYQTGYLKINQAPLTIQVNDATREYGDQNPAWTFEYSGLKNFETDPGQIITEPTVTSNAVSSSDIGEYQISVSGGKYKNYFIEHYVPGTLTIVKAPLTLKVKDATKLYGTPNPSFELEYIGCKAVDTTVSGANINFTSPFTFSCDANANSSCGEYSVTVSGGECLNYTINDRLSGKLYITKQVLTVYPEDAEREYGQENPEFELVYSGFVNGDTPETLTELPTIVTDATIESLPGRYEVNLTGGVSHNYTFKFFSGELVIKKNTLSFASNNYSCTYDGENHMPDFICSGIFPEDKINTILKITRKTLRNIDGTDYWLDLPVNTICEAGEYKLSMYYADETLDAFDFADFIVYKAPSTLTILNADKLSEIKVDEVVEIQWECDAPHDYLGVLSGSDAPVSFNKIETTENGITTTKYQITAWSVGEGLLRLVADGSSNHSPAICEIHIKVTEDAGVDDVLSDNIYITTEQNALLIHNGNDNDIIRIFDLKGQQLYYGNDSRIELNTNSVYIVLINNKSFKIKL